MAEPSEPARGGLPLGWVVALILGALFIYDRVQRGGPGSVPVANPTPSAETSAARRGPPGAVELPQTGLLVIRERAVAPSVAPSLEIETAPPPADPAASPIGPDQTLDSPPEAAESSVDEARRRGAAEFEHEMQVLSQKADQADIAWQRFQQGCRMNVTSMLGVAAAADREWLVFAGVSVVKTEWTAACAEAGTFFSLVAQVKQGMCVAEDRARMSWVYPGTRRDARRKYRLDWDGWEGAC